MADDKQPSPAPKKEVKPTVVDKAPSNVEFVGEGAEKIKFTPDPKAKLIRVNSSGIVQTYL